jgi:endonuclease I
MKKFVSLLFVLSPLLFAAQSLLTAGDVAVIAHNNDNSDQVVLVALAPIAQGTVIRITDNGFTGTALTTTEGMWTYTFPTAVAAGSTFSLLANSPGVAASGTFELNTSGDQIIIYQTVGSTNTYLYAFSSRAWVTGNISQTTSRVPTGLVNGTTARDFSSEVDNGFYNQTITTGSKAAILSSIGTTTKWTRSNNRYSSFPTRTFTLGTGVTPEPTQGPQSIAFSGIKSFNYNVSWTNPVGAYAGCLALRSTAPITVGPVDGQVYLVGNAIGTSKVAYGGTGNTFVQQDVVATTTYYYAFYPYNGSGTSINYGPAALATVISATGISADYYTGIVPGTAGFVSALQTRVQAPYTQVSYANYDETMVTQFACRDTSAGQKTVTCVYSGQNIVYTPPFAWTPATPFSREHTWCHSWMPSYTSTSTREYSDQHHLFPTNQNSANAVRSNRPLGNVVSVISSFLAGSYGYDANGYLVYEPRDQQKGDAARALLYMTLRYHGVGGLNWTFGYLNGTTLPAFNEDPQLLSLLLEWHAQDPPNAYEIARNEYIQSIQGNRNPFIDQPDWVYYIDFNNLTSITTPAALDLAEEQDQQLLAKRKPVEQEDMLLKHFPNPAQDVLHLAVFSREESELTWRLYDQSGRLVDQTLLPITAGGQQIDLNTARYENGLYVAVLSTANWQRTERLVIQH